MRANWTGTLATIGTLLACGLTAAPAQASYGLSYYGGPVLHDPQVVLVDWGSGVGSTYTDATTGDPGLLTWLTSQSGLTGTTLGVLAQYTDDLAPGRALQNSSAEITYGGQYTLAPASSDTTISDSTIQTQLEAWIANKQLPAPTGGGLGTIYMILFPKADVVNGPSGTGTSGTDFCAYHNTGGSASAPLLYAIIPDNGPNGSDLWSEPGCGAEATPMANQSSALSHELAETINDPEIGLDPSVEIENPVGWYDTHANDPEGGGEIADICDTGQNSSDTEYAGGWYLQNVWSNRDSACEGAEGRFTSPTSGSIVVPAGVGAGQPAAFSTSGTSDGSGDYSAPSRDGTLGPGIASYDWNWGDGSADSSGASPSHTYATAGPETVTLRVTDDLGFSATTSTKITVLSGVPAVTTDSPATEVGISGATVSGSIVPNGVDTTYHFAYGLSPSTLDLESPSVDAGSGAEPVPVSVALSGLGSGTTYYYELVADAGTKVYTGTVDSFLTEGPQVTTDSPATSITESSAQVPGTLDPQGTDTAYDFVYGTSPEDLNESTTPQDGGAGHAPEGVGATLSGLAAGTTYYYELVGTQGSSTYDGGVQSFTTVAAPAASGSPSDTTTTPSGTNPSPSGTTTTASGTTPGGTTSSGTGTTSRGTAPSSTLAAPSARTGKPEKIGDSTARLTGTVNPEGSAAKYMFQWGTSPRFGHTTKVMPAGRGFAPASVSASVSGLKAGAKYYYRLLVANAGGLATAQTESFRTHKAASPHRKGHEVRAARPARRPLPRLSFRVLRARSLGTLRIRFSCDRSCTAGFSVMRLFSRRLTPLAQPVTYALASAHLPARGAGTVMLGLTPAGRKLSGRLPGVALKLVGVAWNQPGVTLRPVAVSLRLSATRR